MVSMLTAAEGQLKALKPYTDFFEPGYPWVIQPTYSITCTTYNAQRKLEIHIAYTNIIAKNAN